MHISSFQGLGSSSNADAPFRREQSVLRSDGVVLVWITAMCTLLALAAAVTTMKLNPDLFLMMAG